VAQKKGKLSGGKPIEDAIDSFLTHKKARGVAEQTLIAYDSSLFKNFMPWVQSEGLSTMDQLDPEALDRFSVWVRSQTPAGKPRSEETIRAYIRPVTTLLNWAERVNMAGSGRARPTPPQRATRKRVEVLTRDEIDRMEAAANWERDKLIIRILADTGCRRGECLGLTPQAITHEHDGYFFYFFKPGRMATSHTLKRNERKVPCSPKLYRRLQTYIKGLPPKREGNYIFLANRQRWAKSGANAERTLLRGDSLTQMIRFTARHAGIERRVWPHLFRHSFISWCWDERVEMMTCARWVGHEDLEMVQEVYGHPSDRSSYSAMIRLIDGKSPVTSVE
jgi:integrase/recombinase XerD